MALEMFHGNFLSSGNEYRGLMGETQKQEVVEAAKPEPADITQALLQALLKEREGGKHHHHHHRRHGHSKAHKPHSWRLDNESDESGEFDDDTRDHKTARHEADHDVFEALGHSNIKEENEEKEK